MRKFCFQIAICASTLGLIAAPVFGGTSLRLRIGQGGAGPPIVADEERDCSWSYVSAARQICASRGEEQFQVYQEGFHSGGKCGWHWYRINCGSFKDPATVCITGVAGRCGFSQDATFHCSTHMNTATSQICTEYVGNQTIRHGGDHQLSRSQAGGECGHTLFNVYCNR